MKLLGNEEDRIADSIRTKTTISGCLLEIGTRQNLSTKTELVITKKEKEKKKETHLPPVEQDDR